MKQKYYIEQNFFEEIDTEEKAYILGFLYADGYNNENRHEVKIRLSIKDEKILLKLRDILYPHKDRPLYYFNNRRYCELYIFNRKISSDLSEHGCGQAKTFKVNFPYFLNKNLYRHFIRGVFDGDGSICLATLKNGKHKTLFSIIGYAPFISAINKIISNECGLNENKLIKYKGKDDRISTLAFSGCRQCIKIREYLYKDATIFLNRKYNIFKKLGTEEWRTYENIKIKINGLEKVSCCICKRQLNYKHKMHFVQNVIYCNKCYHRIFVGYVKRKDNIIIKNEDTSILKIKNENILFDTEDLEIVNLYKWNIEHGRVVCRTSEPKKCLYLNRIILNAQSGQSVAFKDGNSFNMKKENLEMRNHR